MGRSHKAENLKAKFPIVCRGLMAESQMVGTFLVEKQSFHERPIFQKDELLDYIKKISNRNLNRQK